MTLTYRELFGEVRDLAREVRRAADSHRTIASLLTDQAREIGHVAEQIAALHVDAATIAETRQVARIMQGLSTAALAYADATEAAAGAAEAVQGQAVTDHGAIQEAVDRSPVPMAARDWYTQE